MIDSANNDFSRPNSETNTQKCFCGSRNCRGIIGPRKPNESKIQRVAASAAKIVGNTTRKVKKALGVKVEPESVPQSPRNRPKTIDPRRNAGPAVQPIDLTARNTQQQSREERALKRSASMVTLSSKRSVSVNIRKSLNATPQRRHTLKRMSETISRSARAATPVSRTLIESKRKLATPVTNKLQKSRFSSKKVTKAASRTSSKASLIGKNKTIRQTKISLSQSTLSLSMPSSPESVVRQSSRQHKPTPKAIEIAKASSSAKKAAGAALISTQLSSWSPPASDSEDDIVIPDSEDSEAVAAYQAKKKVTVSRLKVRKEEDMTSAESPRRLSKRPPKPSPKVLDNVDAKSRRASGLSNLNKKTEIKANKVVKRHSMTSTLKSSATAILSGSDAKNRRRTRG